MTDQIGALKRMGDRYEPFGAVGDFRKWKSLLPSWPEESWTRKELRKIPFNYYHPLGHFYFLDRKTLELAAPFLDYVDCKTHTITNSVGGATYRVR